MGSSRIRRAPPTTVRSTVHPCARLSRMNSVPKIAATLLAVLALASCGKSSDEPKSGSSDVSSSPAASASESLSAGPSSTANPSTSKAMAGNGYVYHLPKGWEVITAQLKQNQPGIDTGGRAKPATPPFTANMNTLTTPSKVSGEPTKDDLDALSAQIKGEVKSLAPKIQTKPTVTIAGAPAVHQEGNANSSGTKFYLVQYFVIHKNNNYGLTFAFPKGQSAGAREKIVQPVLASWKWK